MPDGILVNDDTQNMKAIVKEVQEGGIALWSEDRKKDFALTFEQRAKCTCYILIRTAHEIYSKSVSRHFISDRHMSQAKLDHATFGTGHLYDDNQHRYHSDLARVGGRKPSELDDIAVKRADNILRELPSVRKATELIMPDIAKKMDKRDALFEKGKALLTKLEEVCEPIYMSDLDGDTTISEFKKLVNAKNKQRLAIVDMLNEIGKEGCILEDQINKALYKGFPGISNAVIKAIKDHLERVTMMDQMTRRVRERVMFGDSKEALSILERFEKDEIDVSDSIKSEFKKALEVLKLSKKGAR